MLTNTATPVKGVPPEIRIYGHKISGGTGCHVYIDSGAIASKEALFSTKAEMERLVAIQAARIIELQSALASMPKTISYTVAARVVIGSSPLKGTLDVNAAVAWLRPTDKLIECQPLADLPSDLGLVSIRCPSADVLRLRFLSPSLAKVDVEVKLRLTTQREVV